MSTDLKSQIREYAALVESAQTPVPVEEIRLLVEGRDGTEPVVGRPPSQRMTSMRRPWPALVAAVVLLLLFGALALLLPPDESIPPADSSPPPIEWESGYYTTSAVPDGFVLQDMDAFAGSLVSFVNDVDGVWVPTEGGFTITQPLGAPSGLPVDPVEYIEDVVEAVPGSSRVEVGGRPGVILEARFEQDGLTAPMTWVLGTDGQGGVFEVTAVGMSRDDVLAVADGVERIEAEELVELGSQVTWDVNITEFNDGFTYEVPDEIEELALETDVFLGLDVLLPRLAHANDDDTPDITTDDGQVVDSEGQEVRAFTASLYLQIPQGAEDRVLAEHASSKLSLRLREARVDRYVEHVRAGEVLSEDPYVIQAPLGPEPRFDTSDLGEELTLEPAMSAGVVPATLSERVVGVVDYDTASATAERPVVVIGTSHQPGSKAEGPGVTALVWFTDVSTTCVGRSMGTGMGSGCGSEILGTFGFGGESRLDGASSASYTVPLETSVVQIIANSSSYWQRPAGGHGVIAYDDNLGRPVELIAYDADGNEIGSWSVGSR